MGLAFKGLSAQINFYSILSACVEGHVKKSLKFMSSRPLKPGCFSENLLSSKVQNHFPAEIIP